MRIGDVGCREDYPVKMLTEAATDVPLARRPGDAGADSKTQNTLFERLADRLGAVYDVEFA